MSDVNLQISDDVIKGIVTQKIHSEVATSLAANSGKIIDSIVKNALGQKVDRDGKIARYSSDAKFNSYIEYVIHKQIQAVSGEIVAEWMEKSKKRLKKEIEATLTKKAKSISSSLIDNFILSSQNNIKYHLSVLTDGDNIDRRIRKLEDMAKKENLK